jgi:hypothetical protein
MPEFAALDVARVARQAVRDNALPLNIIGAVVARGSDYVELLVNIIEYGREPCLVSVGVFRNVSEAHLAQEITRHLRRHVDDRSSP